MWSALAFPFDSPADLHVLTRDCDVLGEGFLFLFKYFGDDIPVAGHIDRIVGDALYEFTELLVFRDEVSFAEDLDKSSLVSAYAGCYDSFLDGLACPLLSFGGTGFPQYVNGLFHVAV
jgi:hypothetical protein